MIGLLAGILVAIPTTTAGADIEGSDVDHSALFTIDDANGAPPARSTDVALSSSDLRSVVAAQRAGIDRVEVADDGSIVVEILYQSTSAEARRSVLGSGGEILGEVEGWLLLARLPVDRLEAVEASAGIQHLRLPLKADIQLDDAVEPVQSALANQNPGEHIDKMNADQWHLAGFTGAGLNIGIIDSFSGASWTAAQNAGELPAPSGTFCMFLGSACDVFGGVDHGVGVAEVIHELVPDANLYIADVFSATDIQAAVDFFDANNVVLINRSQGAFYDGPGDGTGPLNTVADNAVSDGMAFFNSAGNFSGEGTSPGAYWRDTWTDNDADGWMEFASGDETMGFLCGFILGLRWDDWGNNRTDYDLYVYDDPNDFPGSPIRSSVDDQQAGADPIENTGDAVTLGCSGGGDADYMAIFVYDTGNGTGNDTLEFSVNNSSFEYWSNPYSANQPISDSFNPGVVSVGAIDPAQGVTIASYSSWGPTNDERTKPDLSAAACLDGYVYGVLNPYCFNGTSSASPASVGAAALVLSAGLASTPAQLTSWIYTNAITDRGAGGTDTIYGRGELILPSPPGGGGGPANDDWQNSHEFTSFPFTDMVATDTATVEGWEPVNPDICGPLPADFGATVWYTYTPIASHSITVDTLGSDFDTVIAAWWYDPGENLLWPIDCNDDANPGVTLQSELTLALTGNVIYFFQVGGYGGASGDLEFNASAPGPLCFGLPGTHVGTANADVITGTSGVDVIIGRGGNDTLNGAGGGDYICGNDGGDTINGQGGNDTISGGGGGDVISGGNGNDTISGDNGADEIDGDAGNDTIDGRRAQDIIRGGDGDDVLNGNDNPDIIEGGDGDDIITGGPGSDDINGDADNDTIEGNRAPDTLRGGTGNDVLDGGEGLDTVRGDGGNDTLLGGLGGDSLIGGNGSDTASFEKSRNPVTVDLTAGTAAGDGADTLTQIEHVIGSQYNDTITGDGAANTLDGAAGHDDISGMGDDDTVLGGAGNDTLRGNGGDDWLRGQAGNDVLNGGGGTDTLDGGGGSNSCSAGEILSNC